MHTSLVIVSRDFHQRCAPMAFTVKMCLAAAQAHLGQVDLVLRHWHFHAATHTTHGPRENPDQWFRQDVPSAVGG